jgi:hypothetical protein
MGGHAVLFGGGPSKVDLLSNSLNRAAGHWPFCMSLLAADVALHVRRWQTFATGVCLPPASPIVSKRRVVDLSSAIAISPPRKLFSDKCN